MGEYGLKSVYGNTFTFPTDNTSDQKWWDQKGIGELQSLLEDKTPVPVQKGLALAHAYDQGFGGDIGDSNFSYEINPKEESASVNWGLSFNEGTPEVPKSYVQGLLESREGFRDDVYLDSLGKPTVGHGHLLGEEYRDQVGTKPFSKEKLDSFFKEDIATATEAAKKNIKNFDKLNRAQQGALISMAFQLGPTGQSKFENMIEAIESGRHEEVGQHALDSLWAQQTPKRAQDIVQAFNRGGITQPIYPVQYLQVGTANLLPDEDIWGDSSASTGSSLEELAQQIASGAGIDRKVSVPESSDLESGRGPVIPGLTAQEENPGIYPGSSPLANQQVVTDPGEEAGLDSGGFGIDPGENAGFDVTSGEQFVPPLKAEPIDTYQALNRGNITAQLNKDKQNLEYAIKNNDVKAIQYLEGKIKKNEAILNEGVPTLNEATANDLHNDNKDINKEIENLNKIKENSTSETVKAAIDAQISEKNTMIAENNQFINETIGEDVQAGEEGAATSPEEAEVKAQEEINNNPEAKSVDEGVKEAGGVDEGAAGNALDQMPPAAKETIFKQAQELLGITGQDLARFALYYAGGRLTGGSHAGSMQWAGIQALKENQARTAAEYKLATEQAKAGSKGPDLTSTTKHFEVGGNDVRANWSKTHQAYVFEGPDGKLRKIPAGAREVDPSYKDSEKVQDDFVKTVDSFAKSLNANKKDDEIKVAVDQEGIADQAVIIYDELKDHYGKNYDSSRKLRSKIDEAIRETIKTGGGPNQLRGEVNKKLVKLKVGISENQFGKTTGENFNVLDQLIENESTDNADYKADWLAAKSAWDKLPAAKKKKWSAQEGWDGFAWFTYQVLNDNVDAINDAKIK